MSSWRTCARRKNDERAHEPPTGVDLAALQREARRRGRGVVVVVQALAAGRRARASCPFVAEFAYGCLPRRWPIALIAPDSITYVTAWMPAARNPTHSGKPSSDIATTRIAIPIAETDERVVEGELVEPVVRDVAGVLPRVRVVAWRPACRGRRCRAAPARTRRRPGCADPRSVSVDGVVLAVHRDPLARPHPGGHPDDEPARKRDHRMHRQGPVRERPVQVDRGRRQSRAA